MLITGLDDFPTAAAVFPFPLADGRVAMAFVHARTPDTDEIAYSAAYLVDGEGRATKVGQSEPLGKDIACALFLRGTILRLVVTEPPPGGGGADSQAHWYDFDIGVGVAVAAPLSVARFQVEQWALGIVNQQLRNAPTAQVTEAVKALAREVAEEG